ncbi:hypothetical protein [Oceanihabitans sediminis]|uniref:DUF7695 domain-containing protein n=1 Tax=Oceanihabitans sediminis TaxID=1812012 RepID=UPI00299EE610|nr:hypothetical protein [Oceanihabitans sediminis]MDX1279236.1 hypothetical protein [Oceanihabitans sediminis]
MKIQIYKCPECKQWIYSRARHDFKECKCGTLAVDGGHGNDNEGELTWMAERFIGDCFPQVKMKVVDIDITVKDMYDDWNYRRNKLGVWNEGH